MKHFSERMQRIFMAAAFAEAGEFETARQISKEARKDERHGIRLTKRVTRMSVPGVR